jgi:RND family efflux transporter MFP subunit
MNKNSEVTQSEVTMSKRSSLLRQLVLTALVAALFAIVCVVLSRKAGSDDKRAAPALSKTVISVAPEGVRAADIQVAMVQSQTLPETIHTTGQVFYSPDSTVRISPRLAGRVKQVFARVGDRVSAGQTLAILDSVDAATARTTAQINESALHLSRKNLDRAQRAFDLGTPEATQAQSTLEEAKTAEHWARKALDKIKLQATIGGFTQKPLEDAENALVAARSSLQQAQADLNLAQKDYARKVKLVDIGVAAQSDLDISQDTLDKARVNLQAGQDTVRLAQQALDREKQAFQSHLYADQQVNQARSAYEQAVLLRQAAERALLLAKAAIRTTLDQARNDYRTAELNALNSKQALTLLGQPGADGTLAIKAPISGVVTERFIAQGQVVDQSQMTPWQMFTLASTDRVRVEADIYEKDLSAVGEGMPVHIHVAAFPNREFSGMVLHIAPTLNKTSRAISVRAEVDNRGGLLKDGMYANVDIRLPNGRPETVIPLMAVQHDQDNDYVYVADHGKYLKRPIHLSGQENGHAIVAAGLKPGEQIVTHGAIYLGIDVSGD